jgi:hypothetical protein
MRTTLTGPRESAYRQSSSRLLFAVALLCALFSGSAWGIVPITVLGGKADVDGYRARVDGDALDPNVWSGRVSQEVFVELAVGGRASMYPAFDWSVMLRATMDISALAVSLADRPQLGHSGHQCSQAPGRPILHLISSSRRPRQ